MSVRMITCNNLDDPTFRSGQLFLLPLPIHIYIFVINVLLIYRNALGVMQLFNFFPGKPSRWFSLTSNSYAVSLVIFLNGVGKKAVKSFCSDLPFYQEFCNKGNLPFSRRKTAWHMKSFYQLFKIYSNFST